METPEKIYLKIRLMEHPIIGGYLKGVVAMMLNTPKLMSLLTRLGIGLKIICYLQINEINHVYIMSNLKIF